MLKKALLAIMGYCLCSTGFAIPNIESVRPGMPDEGLSGNIKLGIDGKTGNNREESLEGALYTTYRQSDNIFLGIAEREYGTTRKVRDTNSSFLHTRWIHLITPTFASEAFIQWEEDEFSNLESRLLGGGNGRFILADEKDRLSLAVGLGAFREKEIIDLGTFTETNLDWRLNSYINYSQRLNDQVTLASTAYYQPMFDDTSDYRVLLNLGLAIKLTDHLDFHVSYKVDHDSKPVKNLAADPPIDNYKTNTEYSTGLIYNF